MILEFVRWAFIHITVTLGIVFLVAYPPLTRRIHLPIGDAWRGTVAAIAMAIFCMYSPWVVGPGQQVDIRNVPLGLNGWRYGWKYSAVVGAVIIAVRAIKGGPGVLTTIPLTILCVAMVPLFRKLRTTWWSLALMGLAQAAALYLVGQTMVHPQPKGLEPTSPLWLFIVASYIIGAWLMHAASQHVLERQLLQERLEQELRSKETILEMMPHGILFLDADRRVVHANRAALRLLYGKELPPAVLAHPDVDAALREGRRSTGSRVTLPARNSTERIVQVSTAPLQGGGAIMGIENVTVIIREERESALRQRLELLGRLAAMAAHEIRNPLTTIKGFVQLLSARPEFAGHRSTFSLVKTEVEHINRVVSDFLDLSRTPAAAGEVLLGELVQEVLDSTSLQFPENGVAVHQESAPGLSVRADRRAVVQILKNLVANAYEAMSGGGDLWVVSRQYGDKVCIAVSDSGPGIDSSVLPHIFTPYTTTKATGTGLGLAISHKLAADMGGSLEVVSSPGMGCTFTLSLPA